MWYKFRDTGCLTTVGWKSVPPVRRQKGNWLKTIADRNRGKMTHLFRPRDFYRLWYSQVRKPRQIWTFPRARDVALHVAHSRIVYEKFFLESHSMCENELFADYRTPFGNKNWFTLLSRFIMLVDHVEKNSMAKAHDSQMASIPSELVGFHWPQLYKWNAGRPHRCSFGEESLRCPRHVPLLLAMKESARGMEVDDEKSFAYPT